MRIFSALCGGRRLKKTSPSTSSSSPQRTEHNLENNEANSIQIASTSDPALEDGMKRSSKDNNYDNNENNNDTQEQADPQEVKQLPLPPAMMKPMEPSTLTGSLSCKDYMTKSSSVRDFASRLSAQVSRTKSLMKDLDKKKSKMKSEDSVWTKAIILGEKCKVPNDDGEGSSIVYDKKGNKIPTYHPRTTSSLSRSTSFIERDSVSSQKADQGTITE